MKRIQLIKKLFNFPFIYVFKGNYRGFTIEKVENYIKKYHHLPWFKSEEEIITNGIDVKEILKSQQETIEEMMLYIISLKKEINELKNK